jgi:putative addiction module component (TIGR02574 family)
MELTARALNLPARSRARLASQLLESIDARQQTRMDAIWAREVEARLDAYEAGDKRTVAVADVLAY